ncbi:MAG TPA: carboxypeptidase-like regulatory domain-containing protein [Pyrinomonadaceae bacterium]|jgi:hypothetical protein
MTRDHHNTVRSCFSLVLFVLACLALAAPAAAQSETTGAFLGEVVDASTGAPVAGAVVQFTYTVNGVQNAKITDGSGRFQQGLLGPGEYVIKISKPGYQTQELARVVYATQSNVVLPPVKMETERATPTPTPTAAVTGPGPTPSPTPSAAPGGGDDFRIAINRTDGRRGGAFTDTEVSTLPLGGTTLTRTFDKLALLLPGVALPPQTIGNIAGPGVGAGVGSAGQFSVNGLRSRANNFTVDGSDNNDEDIGVRRQGFLALVPQPIESIQEYHVTTLLAPAQYGRNLGAQVNAISKSGGASTHGTIFGLFNSSQLNARNFFDAASGATSSPLQGRAPDGTARDVFINGQQQFVSNGAAGREDSFTLGQGGFAFGGPLVPEEPGRPGRSMFYFISAEGQLLHATKEVNFAVPTVAQRGVFGRGAVGASTVGNSPIFPANVAGNAIFSFFPFPNNPSGIYGANTLTQELPADGEGKVISGKVDANFRVRERQQSFTARYNFTDDWRDIPVTGGALFSRLRPRVRTQNLSTFLNSEISGPNAATSIYNQLRASYGRTRLIFDEGGDSTGFLVPSSAGGLLSPDEQQFLINAPMLFNVTTPGSPTVQFLRAPGLTAENFIGTYGLLPTAGPLLNIFNTYSNPFGFGFNPVGQISIAGFSPVGVDVFNFPQRRVNNTYQLADVVTVGLGKHGVAFGADIRRTELNSRLPRNSRPLITFGAAPNFFGPNLVEPSTLAALGAPSGVFQTLTTGSDSTIHLRYYQYDFFGQDEWRIRRNLSLSYGLRYEYNTPPRESNQLIESTFNSAQLTTVGLQNFVAGRSGIFDPDRNNLEPRLGIAYAPEWFGARHSTVLRAGFGIFHDQILGAVVSQSRNVFPTFLTFNFAGGLPDPAAGFPPLFALPPGTFNIFTPFNAFISCTGGPFGVPLIVPGTLNRLNPAVPVGCVVDATQNTVPADFNATLPARTLDTPEAYHYAFTFEQELGQNMVASVAYVGTQGRHLLRLTTPNGGSNLTLRTTNFLAPTSPLFFPFPIATGVAERVARPNALAGAVNIYESSANSRYDSLQAQLRGRFFRRLQYQVSYTLSKATDDVSDVFDLAGASALPQDSFDLRAERGPSNFDARHRFSYNFIYDFPNPGDGRSRLYRSFLGGLQIAGTGTFQTGQPFTVNTIYDVNLDGNLTDRLNSTAGIERTGDRRQPLRLTVDPATLRAALGQNGQVGRNTFRAGNILELDLALIKRFAITERQGLIFRVEVFNFINRANFGVPVRFLEAPGFGQATETVTPGRRIQFSLKYDF